LGFAVAGFCFFSLAFDGSVLVVVDALDFERAVEAVFEFDRDLVGDIFNETTTRGQTSDVEV